MGQSGGFNGPTSNSICTVLRMSNQERFGCEVTSDTSNSEVYYYRLQTQENLPANNDYEIMLSSQNGNANEGINFPTVAGVYKVEIRVDYSNSISTHVSQPHYVEVYGPDFNLLNFVSTVSNPEELNMILVELKPSNTIDTNEQLVIEIPTVALDGTELFPEDLGVGYEDYDELEFDLYESDISSMSCKVYTGDKTNNQPVKIVCSNFNVQITTSRTLKFGFWVRNPSTLIGLAIPVQVYSYDAYRARKDCWTMLEAGINVIPTTNTPISDLGNFEISSRYRQISSQHFDFTTRNTQPLVENDLYILKFNFDLRNQQKFAGNFKYNSGLANSGDVIFMRNCKTVILRVGAGNLTMVASGSTDINARMQSVFYNPYIQLTSA